LSRIGPNSKPAKVFDLLGKPEFKRADDLNDDQLEKELEKINDLLSEKNVEVYFGDDEEYDSPHQVSFYH